MSPVRKRPPFEWLHQEIAHKIEKQKLHFSQHLPGMTSDEVRAEMLESLWRAWDSYSYSASSGVPIEKYFWSVWTHRKADLLKYYFRQRRDIRKEVLEPVLYDEVGYEEAFLPPPPVHSLPDERRMWALLAQGYAPQEVQEQLHMPVRIYYRIIHKWQAEGRGVIA